jgi:hypothetical protein
MPYRIAGIDVHKRKLAVVVTDVEVEEEYLFERRWYGSNPEQLQLLVESRLQAVRSTLCSPRRTSLERLPRTSCDRHRRGYADQYLACEY